MTKTVSIFGATGSIGGNALDILGQDGRDGYEIAVLTGGRNIAKLVKLALLHKPKRVVAAFREDAEDLRAALPPDIDVAAGSEALLAAAEIPVDWALNAIVGAAGLPVSLKLAKHAKILALANKESLVAGGALLKKTVATHGGTLVPVDSEHSAIFQCLQGESPATISRVILTASGGPFRTHSLEALKSVTVAEALKHPNWEMGKRITIDSASMYNKALELIEAQMLFDLAPDRLEVIVHPQSLVHSMVEFCDRGILAHLGPHDMRHAIGYALDFPHRAPLDIPPLDFTKTPRLDFEAPDMVRFPAIKQAFAVMRAGGATGAAFNAAKEIALDRFLEGEIGFLDMADIVGDVMKMGGEAYGATPPDDLDTILAVDEDARYRAGAWARAA